MPQYTAAIYRPPWFATFCFQQEWRRALGQYSLGPAAPPIASASSGPPQDVGQRHEGAEPRPRRCLRRGLLPHHGVCRRPNPLPRARKVLVAGGPFHPEDRSALSLFRSIVSCDTMPLILHIPLYSLQPSISFSRVLHCMSSHYAHLTPWRCLASI